MTNEEMQRAMDFMVQQQAQASARMDSVGQKLEALAETQTRNAEGIGALLALAEIHEREILANAQHISAVSRDVAALGETTRATDERLNALINAVERQISNGRNAK